MNEELQKLKEEFEQRIKELEDKYEPKEEFPKEGDDFWYIMTSGKVNNATWVGSMFDEKTLEFGNFFRTEAEAEFELERLKVLRELGRIGKPFDCTSDNWSIYLDIDSNVNYYLELEYMIVYGHYYFRSEDEVKEAIEKIGEDRIKKYLFGVKEGDSE